MAFLLAIGSAFASEYLLASPAWTSKSDVPVQANNCELRGQCQGTMSPCTISIDHDGNPATTERSVQLYDGSVQSQQSCGVALLQD